VSCNHRQADSGNVTGPHSSPTGIAVDMYAVLRQAREIVDIEVAPFAIVDVILNNRKAVQYAHMRRMLSDIPLAGSEKQAFVNQDVFPMAAA